MKNILIVLTILVVLGRVWYSLNSRTTPDSLVVEKKLMTKIIQTPADLLTEWTQVATFAAWCFWCTEAVFQEEPGVLDAISWYAWWVIANPTYEQVWYGKTDYREAIQVTYNENEISYERLLDLMLRSIDPTDWWGQFGDRWFHYTTAIFAHTDEQRSMAEEVLSAKQNEFDKPIVTLVLPFTTFYKAEEYHQDFYKHSKERYARYKKWSWRTAHFEETWLDEILEAQKYPKKELYDQDDLRSQLTPLQWKVTQEDGTEPSFKNEYRDNEEPGLYVDIVSWEPLYSSKHKYKSGTWWPSFTQPITEDAVTLHEDNKLWAKRTEVRSAEADSHLGHVFTDWPQDAWWLRYCMNSASMNFIPLNEMEKRGYGEWIEYVE